MKKKKRRDEETEIGKEAVYMEEYDENVDKVFLLLACLCCKLSAQPQW